ncbi:YggT family protein [Bombilactobacillus bombi]|uniref:YggT family protein n=1 Tax=Bombilactobacillus bombi TaxID=1303590 RepID=UPI0035E8F253
MANVINGLPIILIDLIDLYKWIIIIYCFMSWLPGAATSKLGVFIGRMVDPFLGIFDLFIPPILGISFSPIFAFIVLDLLARFIGMIF